MRDAEKDEYLMGLALEEAKKCALLDEVPVGAVIVRKGEVIAAAGNGREQMKDATCHAETSAIREACKKLGGWHLTDCTMYVTLEPCPMCAGAILNSRIDTVVIGTPDEKSGAFGGAVNLSEIPSAHHPEIVFGVRDEESREILKAFFKEKRERGARWKKASQKS